MSKPSKTGLELLQELAPGLAQATDRMKAANLNLTAHLGTPRPRIATKAERVLDYKRTTQNGTPRNNV